MTSIASRPQPLVSVIIPYYEQQSFVAEAVCSAKRQTYPKVEIVVVDDGSPVPAEPLLRKFNGVQVLRTENRGVSAARNLGFRASSGDYVVFLDADDVLSPGALEAHLNELLAHPGAGLSFGALRVIDEFGRQLRPSHICRPRTNYFLTLLESNPIGCPGAAMIRRETLIAAGLFDESLKNAEDYHLFLKIARRSSILRLALNVVEYRQHGSNKSRPRERQLANTMAVLDRIEGMLSESERKRLPHARRRWRHEFRRKPTLGYRLWGLYYRFRSMLNVPVRYYFSS